MEKGKKTTKDKILEFLKKEVSLTVNDLTTRLGITHMAVRKHLDVLQKDHLIQSREVKQSMGRPLQIYSLTALGEKYFPKNYEGIALEFLQDIKELYGEDSIETLFRRREERLIKEYSMKITLSSNQDKMKQLLQTQNEKGYMADVVQTDTDTFELIEYNCPIIEVANYFKSACKFETEMYKKVFHTENVSRVNCKTDGNDHCKFLIKFV